MGKSNWQRGFQSQEKGDRTGIFKEEEEACFLILGESFIGQRESPFFTKKENERKKKRVILVLSSS